MQAPAPQAPRKLNPRAPVGGHHAPPPSHVSAVASGPTVLLEDSQVFPASQTPLGSQVVNRTPRARTILSAEAEEEAIQLTSEGKITTKNAWNIKLLEGIHDSVSNALSNTGAGEDAAQFTKCANLVEGGAKIWTQRVEHTAARSNQIVRRLHRTDGKDDDDANGDGTDGANQGDDGESGRRAAKKAARKRERTVAECLSEINLDPKARALALLQSGSVSAQFRAITEKFEQGHAQGLLLNNAPMGSVGNLILDVDYARVASRSSANNPRRCDAEPHHQHSTEHINHLGHASPTRPRLSTQTLANEVLSPENSRSELEPDASDSDLEQAFVMDVDIHVEPPNQRTSWGSMSSGAGNVALPAGRRGGRGSTQLQRLTPSADELYVPNMSQALSTKAEGGADAVSSPQTPGRGSDGMGSSPRGRSGSRADAGWNDDGGPNDYDDGPDGDYGDDFDDDDDNRRAPSQSQSEAYTASRAASSVRDLISGAAELAYFDHMMGAGAQQLAVAADDPNSWFPMTSTDATSIGLQRGSSFLQQIRRETLLQQRTASQEPNAQAAAGGARKKARTEKQGVVAVGESIDDFIAPSEVVTLASNDNKLMNPRRENLRKPTEEFKERFYYKRSTEMATEHNVLLVDVDTKGALPWWLPHQASDIAELFQPFASPSIGWNVLNKRVATSDDAARLVGPYGRGSALVGDGADDGVDRDGVVGDMPLRVFDDDEMEGGDFGDDGLMDDDGDDVAYAAGFDLPRISVQDDDVDPDHGTDLGHFVAGSAVEGGNAEEMLDIMERPDVIRALESHHATVPTQVDVVRLRRIMWHHTQRLIKETQPEMIMVPKEGAETTGKRGARSFGKLKRHQTQLKRGRDDDSNSDDGGDADAHGALDDGSAYQGIPLHRFSHVVAAMLPQIPSVSTTGSLSPAFFFFSLLFLANEHGILLENVKGNVQDIFISGLLDDVPAQGIVAHH